MRTLVRRIGTFCLYTLYVFLIGFVIFNVTMAMGTWPTTLQALRSQARVLNDHEQRLIAVEAERAAREAAVRSYPTARDPLPWIEGPSSTQPPFGPHALEVTRAGTSDDLNRN